MFTRVSLNALGFALALSLPVAASSPAGAQTTPPRAAASPFAPGDLSKPAFDTTKPIFDSLPSLEQSAASVVADVEGRAITLGEIGDTIRGYPPAMAQLPFETLFPGVLEQMIRQQALVIRAQNQSVDEEPAIRRRMKAAADRTLAEEYLRREGGKEITEAALLERYKRDIEGRPGDEEVHARIVMVPTEKEAEAVIAELKAGADFAAVAKRSSKDTTAVAGGDLGFVTRSGMNAEIGSVIFASAPGHLAPYPVRSIGAWFVVRVDERRRRPAVPFQDAREQLYQAMLREAAARVTGVALEGLKVRQFDLLGRETGEYERPAR